MSELEGIQSDDQDSILPHSILGSLKDFRGYLEAKGETEVQKCFHRQNLQPINLKSIPFCKLADATETLYAVWGTAVCFCPAVVEANTKIQERRSI